MAGKFISPDGDLERTFVTDYQMIDQYAMTGSLWNWGSGRYYGQLGKNNTSDYSSPIQTIASGTNWKFVAGGYYTSAGIKTDGTLWMWGWNATTGALGDNTLTDKSSPVQTIAAGTTWKQVSCGYRITASVKTDGTLWTWGHAAYDALGDGSGSTRSSPVQTMASGTNWKLVSCGGYHMAAVKTDGTLWTWGRADSGQLGNSSSATSFSSPVQTIAAGTNWNSVACGELFSVAVKTDGTLWSWGNNAYGQLGNNTTTHKSSPVQTIAGGTNWKSVACGRRHTAAIKTDGTLWGWGTNGGQLGDGTSILKSSPVQTIAGGTNWKFVSCGYYHTAAIKTDGTLWLWGANSYGQLGTNNTTSTTSPVQTIAGGTNWKNVAVGLEGHTLAIYFYDANNQYPSA